MHFVRQRMPESLDFWEEVAVWIKFFLKMGLSSVTNSALANTPNSGPKMSTPRMVIQNYANMKTFGCGNLI